MRRTWDTSKGNAWVVVADWGEETTVEFHHDEEEADKAYETAVAEGASVFYAKTKRLYNQRTVQS